MMETTVELKCMKVDLEDVKAVVEESAKEFSELIQRETKKEIQTKIVINEEEFLDKDNKNAFESNVTLVLEE